MDIKCDPATLKEYTKEDLVDFNMSLFGGSASNFKKFSKKILCQSIVQHVAPKTLHAASKVTKKASVKGSVVLDPTRPCGKKGGKDKYKKMELIYLAMKLLDWSMAKAKKHTVTQLCAALFPTGLAAMSLAPKLAPVGVGDCMKPNTKTLRKHQVQIAKFLKDNRALLLVHQVGTGKTLGAMAATQCLLDDDTKLEVLIITPKAVVDNWKATLATEYGNRHYHRYKFMTEGEFLHLHRDKEDNTKIKSPVSLCRNKILVVDEVHKYKSIVKVDLAKLKGKMAKILIECAKVAHRVLLLSATPMPNRPKDFGTVLSILNKRSPMKAAEINAIMKYFSNGSPPPSISELIRCKISFHNRGKDPNFPEEKHFVDRITMDRKTYVDYMKVEKTRITEDELQSINYLIGKWADAEKLHAFYNALRRAVVAQHLGEGLKIRRTIQLADLGGRTVIFTEWVKAGLKLLETGLKAKGITVIPYYGALSKKARQAAMTAYNNSTGKTVMIITRAGREGLNLFATKRFVVLDMAWNKDAEEQAIGRVIRMYSHKDVDWNHVDIHHLLLVKPKPGVRDKDGVIRERDDENISVDEILLRMQEDKFKKNSNILKEMKKFSIEKLDC